MAGTDPLSIEGHVIDNVRVDALIDEGGFGYVYRGRHLGLDEPVAIKCLKVNMGWAEGAGSFEARFRDETKIAYRLSQGSLDIVRSISSGTLTTDDGLRVPYMVLEWLEGHTLAHEIARRNDQGSAPFTLAESMPLLASAAGALEHAHAQGVVHRDVKPGNLFIAETRDGQRLKVLDFGLAKVLDQDSFLKPESRPTASNVFVCSPAYGAPEQFSKDIGALGPWTDVYSFALVILEMLSGKKAREAGSLVEGMVRALDPRFACPTPADVGVSVNDATKKVLAKAVAFEPQSRWQSAGELWTALVAAVASGSATPEAANAPSADVLARVRERAEAFEAAVAAGGKGGTLAMRPEATVPLPPGIAGAPRASSARREVARAAEKTVRLVGAPSKPSQQVSTLPLGATRAGAKNRVSGYRHCDPFDVTTERAPTQRSRDVTRDRASGARDLRHRLRRASRDARMTDAIRTCVVPRARAGCHSGKHREGIVARADKVS